MDWYDICAKAHRRTFPHDGQLSSLSTEWERELAALWRLEADVNNGAYLQFLSNWGRESYVYASQALKKIGANKMAAIIDSCQTLVDEHFNCDGASQDQMRNLMPNPAMDGHGNLIKKAGSLLPDSVLRRIYDLSYEFMSYPDDLPEMGMRYYTPHVPEIEGWPDEPEDDIKSTAPSDYSKSPEELARIAEADARITDRKCPHCGQPCPSYRKTCKHCRRPVNTS